MKERQIDVIPFCHTYIHTYIHHLIDWSSDGCIPSLVTQVKSGHQFALIHFCLVYIIVSLSMYCLHHLWFILCLLFTSSWLVFIYFLLCAIFKEWMGTYSTILSQRRLHTILIRFRPTVYIILTNKLSRLRSRWKLTQPSFLESHFNRFGRTSKRHKRSRYPQTQLAQHVPIEIYQRWAAS